MNREQLAHVLRSAAQLVDDPEIVVIGSQAILGSFSEEQLPRDAMLSMEADLAFRDDPDEAKADIVDGLIGEASSFHQMNTYYAQGVSTSTATLPLGWQERVVPYERADAEPSRAVCVEAHDLVISKLYAGREKDIAFATQLLAAGLVDPRHLHDRTDQLPVLGSHKSRVHATIDRCARRATAGG